jgi:hypothetical protein
MTYKNIINYPEFRIYLEHSNYSGITRYSLEKILDKKLSAYPSDYNLSMFDVGPSDGEMSLPLAQWLRDKIPNFKYTAVEPERLAFDRLNERTKNEEIEYATTHNLKIEQYLENTKDEKGLFDFILFAHSFYYIPKEEWDNIIESSIRLLKPKGLAIVVLDSYQGEVYKLLNVITDNKTRVDTLEFGNLYSAEDMEKLLNRKDIMHTTEQFPINIFIKDEKGKKENFARHLAFFYRTFTNNILDNYKEPTERFLEEIKKDDKYILENIVKVIIFGK